MKYKSELAFTLAELLITLAIIGIVAAITIPTLIANYKKRATSVSVKNFYAIMQNAISLQNAQEGNNLWVEEELLKTNYNVESFYNKNFNNHISSLEKTKKNNGYSYLIALPNGSGFYLWRSFVATGKELESPFLITYCPDYKYCKKIGNECYDGQNGFLFKLNADGSFTTYCSATANRTYLVQQCADKAKVDHNKAHCCSALLQADNWEIKDDYAWDIK